MQKQIRRVDPLIERVDIILDAINCLGYRVKNIESNGTRKPVLYITFECHDDYMGNAYITKCYYDLLDEKVWWQYDSSKTSGY